MVGSILLDQKCYAECEPLLVSGYEGMKSFQERVPTIVPARLKETAEQLVRLYNAVEKPMLAAEWKAKLEAHLAQSSKLRN